MSNGGSSEGWSVGDGRGNWTGPYYAPEDLLPGFGFPDAPPNAPNDQQDQSTQADNRLSGTFGEQEYYGAKPGEQTGAILVDDGRSTRQPLPGAGCPGGNSGPIKFGHGGQAAASNNGWSVIGPGGIGTGPYVIPAGPWPLLPNYNKGVTQDGRVVRTGTGEEEQEGHDQDSGTTRDQFQAAMDGQRNWIERLNDRLHGGTGRDIDGGDPDSMGEAVAGALIPFGGVGKKLYHKANNATNGALDRTFDNLSPAAADAVATAAIVNGLILIAGVAIAAVTGVGALVRGGAALVSGAVNVARAAAARAGALATGAATSIGTWYNTGGGKELNRFIRDMSARIKYPQLRLENMRSVSTAKGDGVIFRPGGGVSHPSIRIMDPITGKFNYPDGYVRYTNAAGDLIDAMGNVSKDGSLTHMVPPYSLPPVIL